MNDCFRPQRGRWIALMMAVGSVVVFAGLAAAMPATGMAGWTGVDSGLLVALGLVLAAFMVRFAVLLATPDQGGLTVRNLLVRRRVAWAEVARVRFGGGEPWATLELMDGDELAVMAIQRSDGALAQREASRLQALVQGHAARAG